MSEKKMRNVGKKRVLMVHNFYRIGGGEHTVFKNEVDLLRRNGHEVILYTRSNDELEQSRLKLLLSPFSTIWSFKTYREVRRIIRKENIDIVHCHNTFPLISPSVYYAARSCKKPVVQTIHNFRFLCPGGVFFRNDQACENCRVKKCFKDALKYRCYRNSFVQTLVVAAMLRIHRMLGTYRKINYIFLTDFNRKKFSSLIDVDGKNVFVKPNFINSDPMISDNPGQQDSLGKAEFGESDSVDKKRFLYVGRLDAVKGILFLLKEWECLPKNYELRILGDGECEKQVKEAVKKHRNIVYLGFQPRETILQEYKQAAAMLFPSKLYEGFPMTIAESFSAGCPVVSSNVGNQASIIKTSDGGVLFDYSDEKSFLEALDAVTAKRKYYAEKAYQYYREYLTSEENYKRIIKIYDCAECNKDNN